MLPLTGNIFEIMGQHLFKWRDNYSIRTRKAVPLLRNSERQIALTIPSARRGVRVPSKSQVSPIFFCGQGWETEGREMGRTCRCEKSERAKVYYSFSPEPLTGLSNGATVRHRLSITLPIILQID